MCYCFYCLRSTGAAANSLTSLYQHLKDDSVIQYMFFLEVCILFGKFVKVLFFISFWYFVFQFLTLFSIYSISKLGCPLPKSSGISLLFSLSLLYPLYVRFAVPKGCIGYSALNFRRKQTINLYSDFYNSPRRCVFTNCVRSKQCIGIWTRKYFKELINLLFVKR